MRRRRCASMFHRAITKSPSPGQTAPSRARWSKPATTHRGRAATSSSSRSTSRRWSMANRTIAAITLFAVLAPLAHADRKADLQRQAQAAVAARKLDERADAMCELARLDKSKQSDCDIAQQEAAAENRRNDDRFNRGVSYYNSGTMDDAEHEFRNIRF